MKKIICIFAILIAFASCSKEESPVKTDEPQTFYFKVDAENVDGQIKSSNIVTIKL